MEYSLGIDLGTTYSAAATARGDRLEIFQLGERAATVPSVVVLRADGEVLTGDAAERRSLSEPMRTAREFKRRLGDPTPIILGGTPYGAESLTGHLLRSVVAKVTEQLGGPPGAIAVCHPASYGAYKLDLLRQAVRQADIGDVELITEPEAAAVHYALQERVPTGQLIAVYDFGGGTFDATILRKTEAGFEQLGRPEGMERLGGIDFDEAIFAHVLAIVRAAGAQLDAGDPATLAALARLRDECRRAKEGLSVDTDATIPVYLPGVQTEVRLTRAEFETMIRPRIRETIQALERATRSAGLGFEGIDRILLVGGSSRIPLVAEMVRQATGRPVALDAHPKHTMALGAAWVAEHSRRAVEDTDAVVAVGAPDVDAATAVAADAGSPRVRLDERVQFTVYRPRTIQPGEWSTLLAFAHLAAPRADDDAGHPDPIAEVRRQAQQFLGPQAQEFDDLRVDSAHAVPREGEVTFLPTAEGVEFNPTSRTFRWVESVHREAFRMRARNAGYGETLPGRLTVFHGVRLLADITLQFQVGEVAHGRADDNPLMDQAQPYRRVFASYSHSDVRIAEQFEHYAAAIGDRYLRDWVHLRSGEKWSERIAELIREADVFQLFWSWNSMRSPAVRREWEYALRLNRPNFVRPTYWEVPMPRDAFLGLPPPDLASLHFHRIALSALPLPSATRASEIRGDVEVRADYQPAPIRGQRPLPLLALLALLAALLLGLMLAVTMASPGPP